MFFPPAFDICPPLPGFRDLDGIRRLVEKVLVCFQIGDNIFEPSMKAAQRGMEEETPI